MSNTAFIGIGSNLGSPQENCQQSIAFLKKIPKLKIIARSSFYKTEPVGPTDQNWFLNAAIEVTTELEPIALLDALLAIEVIMGRTRNKKWGPRIIDLDLLLYAGQVVKNNRLEIPHPEMTQRRFVLAPLAELAPDWVHPLENKTIRQLLFELPNDKKVIRL